MRLFILLWLVFPIQVLGDSSVWKISNGQTDLYIGGTIHVLSQKDYPLPQEFDQAYQQADRLVLETDLAAMAGLEVQQQLLLRVMYLDGRSLKDDLSASTYRLLADYVSSTGLQMAALDQFKAPLVVLTLTMAELQRQGMAGAGVDSFYLEKATAEGKLLGELESVDLQISIIANMGKGHEDEMILSTVNELKDLPEMMEVMKSAWRSGDADQLEQVALLPMKEDFPALYKSMLVDRNNSWIPKIEAMLETPETEFILVGALHLVAEEGVIAQLIKRGYQVEML